MMYNDSLFDAFARTFEARRETEMPIAEYLESCRGDPMRYASAAERLLAAIGEPQMIETAKDSRLGRIFIPSCSSRTGGAQTDSLSSWAGRRRQVVAC